MKVLQVLFLILPVAAFSRVLDPNMVRGKRLSHKKISVLQNRYFLKALRPEIGVLAGVSLGESYTSTQLSGVRGGVFLNEWAGVEIQVIRASIQDSADREALNKLKFRPRVVDESDPDKLVSPDPEVNSIHSIKDLHGIIAPFYGKVNLMNKAIVYSDLYLSAGLSSIKTDQGSHTGLSFGAGQRFYFSSSWSLRIDYKSRIYNELRSGEKSKKISSSLDFGASYLFL